MELASMVSIFAQTKYLNHEKNEHFNCSSPLTTATGKRATSRNSWNKSLGFTR
jgi:hypothetical protein